LHRAADGVGDGIFLTRCPRRNLPCAVLEFGGKLGGAVAQLGGAGLQLMRTIVQFGYAAG